MAKKKTQSAKASGKVPPDVRLRLSQTDVPVHTLEEALRVAHALGDNYAFQATRPLAVADAMGMKPTTGSFRTICGASIAYGLTEGGCNAPAISLTDLGRRIIAPTREHDDDAAKREAVLRPRVFGAFLSKYDGAKLPPDNIASNVLAELGVPRPLCARTLKLLLESAGRVGLIREIRGSSYIDLSGAQQQDAASKKDLRSVDVDVDISEPASAIGESDEREVRGTDLPRTVNKKVFITHGKNKAFIDPLKQLLAFGDFEPVVSIERESVSKPVPDKVMDDMRQCGAAIIHVDAEIKMMDQEGHEHVVLNPNVLLEIGASMALYGRRFILLVREGVRLPSNLQGLYEVRYEGPKLDSDATIRLMKAINEFKSSKSG